MKVINVKTGEVFDYIEPFTLTDEEYNNSFMVPIEPFKDPVVDKLAIYLYHNKKMLLMLIHNKKSYGCFDPVYVDNKIYTPLEWLYYREFRSFFESISKNNSIDINFDKWKTYVALALAKLTGKFISSSAKD